MRHGGEGNQGGEGDVDSRQKIKDALRTFYAQNVRYHELIDEFEQQGRTYDDILLDLIRRSAPQGRGVRLVDVALGTGHYLARAKTAGAFACGVDLSIHACRLARERDPGLNVFHSDAENLPFRDGTFDVAICLQLLEHTPFPEKVIGEIARVLRSGGRLFLSAPNMLGSSFFSRAVRAASKRFSKATKDLRVLPVDILERWDAAATPQGVSDLDACNRINVFHALNLLRGNGFSIEHLDTLRHPKKYRPLRYGFERVLQRIPLLRYTGINFKIIARKR